MQKIDLELTDENKDEYIILKTLDKTYYYRINHYFRVGRIHKYHTQYGDAVNKKEVLKVVGTRNPKPKGKYYKIDLSTPSRINCMYRRFSNMNTYNQNFIKKDNRLTRFYDQDGYMCISLKEYLKDPVSKIAKRLELKQHEVYSAIVDLLYNLYKEEKEE